MKLVAASNFLITKLSPVALSEVNNFVQLCRMSLTLTQSDEMINVEEFQIL